MSDYNYFSYVKKFLIFDFDVGRIKNTRLESNAVDLR